jgi:hypothetical protein
MGWPENHGYQVFRVSMAVQRNYTRGINNGRKDRAGIHEKSDDFAGRAAVNLL